jgi:hypothetical protein
MPDEIPELSNAIFKGVEANATHFEAWLII